MLEERNTGGPGMEIIVQAPGRVNLIGEHTDYNEGFVLPAAIDLSLTLTYRENQLDRVSVNAFDFNEIKHFSIHHLSPAAEPSAWENYIKAVYRVFKESGYNIKGADLAIRSTIPIGSGLSSSAALELALAAALAKAARLSLSGEELALMCQRAENRYIGVQSGIMDQYAIALGRKNHALFLDCRTLSYEYVPIQIKDHLLLIVDSRVERALAASAYNRRREECSEAVKMIACLTGTPLNALRDLERSVLKQYAPHLPDPYYRRALYVLEENRRVLAARKALNDQELIIFGELMKASHAGLRDLYEVSCPELDTIVDTAVAIPGVLGARMTGAGFGGCVIVLLEKGINRELQSSIIKAYSERRWPEPLFYETGLAEGLKIIK